MDGAPEARNTRVCRSFAACSLSLPAAQQLHTPDESLVMTRRQQSWRCVHDRGAHDLILQLPCSFSLAICRTSAPARTSNPSARALASCTSSTCRSPRLRAPKTRATRLPCTSRALPPQRRLRSCKARAFRRRHRGGRWCALSLLPFAPVTCHVMTMMCRSALCASAHGS